MQIHEIMEEGSKTLGSKAARYPLIRAKPIAVITIVEGRPNFKWVQNERVYPEGLERRACSHTIRFAAEPNNDKFPATVLTHANISHAFFSSLSDIAPAEAATRAPRRSTENDNLINNDYTYVRS